MFFIKCEREAEVDLHFYYMKLLVLYLLVKPNLYIMYNFFIDILFIILI